MRPQKIRSTATRVTALAFALLLVTSVAAVGTAGTASTAPEAPGPAAADGVDVDLENGTADDIYRYANGSAVLVYEGGEATTSSDVQTANFGADVSSALVDAVVVTDYDNQQSADGEFQMMVTPDAISGNGDLTLDRPEQLESLETSLNGQVTPEDSGAEFTLDATYQQQGFSSTPTVDTDGEFSLGPDSFGMTADYRVDGNTGPGSQDSNRTITVEETDSGYEVGFDENRPVSQFRRTDWNTSEAARETISAQYEGLTFQYGGSVDVSIDEYEYTQAAENSTESDRLDIDYTVTLTGVETGVADTVVQQLSGMESTELTAAQQESLRESITNLTIDGVEVTFNQTEGTTEGSAELAISGYQGLVVDYLDITAASSEAVNQSQVDELREQLDARDAADLEQTLSWDVGVTPDDGTTDVETDITYDTQNWGAYTTELADRGIPLETDVSFSAEAATEGESIEMNATFDVSQEALVDSAVSQAVDTVEQSETDQQSAVQAFRALEDADLQVAKADLVFGEDTVEVRASAQFNNLSEFQTAADQFPDDVPITHVYSEQSDGTATSYVYVEELGMSDAELRESTLANDGTTIHPPGEWERTFPNMDIAGTSDYLGVDVQVNNPPNSAGPGNATTDTATPADSDGGDSGGADTATDTSSDGPGFGLVVALVALLAGALVAARRRD